MVMGGEERQARSLHFSFVLESFDAFRQGENNAAGIFPDFARVLVRLSRL